MKKAKSKPKRQRLNMRIPTELLVWAKDFASTKNTSVTQLVVDHLTDLKETHCDSSAIAR